MSWEQMKFILSDQENRLELSIENEGEEEVQFITLEKQKKNLRK